MPCPIENYISPFLGDDEVDESGMTFFHGRIKVHVIQAQDLPDTDTAFFNIDRKDFTDAYVTGDLGEARLFKTRYIENDLNPYWDEEFNIYVCHYANNFCIRVKDKEHVGATFIASTTISAEDIISGEPIEDWYDLERDGEVLGKINLAIQYTPKADLDENTHDLQRAYFPVREGCKLVMYQDADTPQLPVFDGVTEPDGSQYQATRCWKDLYDHLKNAQKFIYIAGWSVNTQISLVRGMCLLCILSIKGNLAIRFSNRNWV